jgi:hypothetical protein
MQPFSTHIIAGLASLDAQLAPSGLYGADRGLVFTKIIYPAFKAQGYRIASFSKPGRYAYLEPKDGGEGSRIELVVVSKIKVRLFGDRFAFDPHIDHSARWDRKRMEKLISKMWGSPAFGQAKYVVLVGYDPQPSPFASELRQLEDSLDWTRRGIHFATSVWSDPHQRAFYTRVCFWTAPNPVNSGHSTTTMAGSSSKIGDTG